MLTIGLVLFSVVALLMFSLSVRKAAWKSENIDSLEARLKSVDLDAFLTLIDHRDAEFLQHALEPPDFRKVQRIRTLAALKYLSTLFSNVAILLHIGDLAGRSEDPRTSEARRELVDAAFRTRFLILRAYLKLAPQFIVPMHSKTAIAQLLYDYSKMSCQVTLLTTFHKSQSSRLSLS